MNPHLSAIIPLFLFIYLLLQCAQKDQKKPASIYEFSAIDIDGNDVSLEKYR
uniref:Uncharacterized protein n=1 Tax=Oryzias latipes TaxID=8090 RepID=A0A3P9IC55_ORYLA